jgi:hypothetical protein
VINAAPHAFLYEACDIPAELTIAEFRARRQARRRNGLRRLRAAVRPLGKLA